MRANDLALPFPAVGMDMPALESARLLANEYLPGLIVLHARGRSATILAGSQVRRMAVPRYCQDELAPARVVDEAAEDGEIGSRTVVEVLPGPARELSVVDAEATVLEIAALMARTRTPLVAVLAGDGSLSGAITLDALLDRPVGR